MFLKSGCSYRRNYRGSERVNVEANDEIVLALPVMFEKHPAGKVGVVTAVG